MIVVKDVQKFQQYKYSAQLSFYFIIFFSQGKGPFSGIVDLYTFGGGLTEPRASLLANKGFVVLALAYYSYRDLPKNPKNLDLEYFEEAVNFLTKRPEVSNGH